MTDYQGILSIPKDIIFPDELNRYLRDQIAAYNLENGMLQKHLQEAEERCVQMQKEIDGLKKQMKSEQAPVMPQFTDSSKTINSKIVELSKNFREKCAEMEKYKTKYSKLLLHLEEIKKRESLEKVLPSTSQEDIKQQNETQAEAKQLLDKINITTNKMLEYKNTNIQLRNELKQANKLLQKEVGEDLNSLQGNSTWKGRAQIICDLQEKNKKLKEKLKNIQELGGLVEVQNQQEKISGKIAILEKANTELKYLNETYKTKIETLKSRCNMLETGHQELKLKTSQLQERSAKELEIIANMSNQLAEAENNRQQALKEKDDAINKLKIEITNLKDQIGDYKVLVNNLKAKMKEIPNEKNNQEITETKEYKDFKQQQEILRKNISNLKEEKLKLLELLDLQQTRLKNERNEHENFQQLYRMEKQKAAKRESITATSDLESSATYRSRYSVLSQSSKTTESNLRDQLELAEENIKALNTRLQLEQREKKQDLQEFAKILKVSNNNV